MIKRFEYNIMNQINIIIMEYHQLLVITKHKQIYHACFHSGTNRFSVSNTAFTFDSTARPIALYVAYGFTKLVSLRICLVCGQILHLLHMFPGCFRKQLSSNILEDIFRSRLNQDIFLSSFVYLSVSFVCIFERRKTILTIRKIGQS